MSEAFQARLREGRAGLADRIELIIWAHVLVQLSTHSERLGVNENLAVDIAEVICRDLKPHIQDHLEPFFVQPLLP